MAAQASLNILEFQKRFGTDDACRDHLFKIRWPEGLVCPKCGGKVFYKITTRLIYECKCGHQVSLTAGTIMHRSQTSLTKWFWAIYLTAHDKRGVSALRLKKELGIAYQTAWTMLHKIRRAMGERDSQYQLAGIVEMDETYIGGVKEGGKRGRGTEKTPVQVGLSLNDEGYPQFVKMAKMDDVTGKSIRAFAVRHIQAGAVVRSDEFRSYPKALAGQPYLHEPERFTVGGNPEHLKWLHRVVGNAKAFILGTYHGLGAKHLQAYIDEFCFRFNRRRFLGQLFNRLLKASMVGCPVTYRELVDPVPIG